MQIVLFTHGTFVDSYSMRAFARMIAEGMESRGHTVQVWEPTPYLFKLAPAHSGLGKWLGYVDRFLVFPWQARARIRDLPPDHLFVFADQALGPWVPLVADRPHVVHCHDFLALRSAMGDFPQNPVKRPGRVYQRFIRNGFNQARNFISVSRQTRHELHAFLDNQPNRSEVVYNGLNYAFRTMARETALGHLRARGLVPSPAGYLLHVGGTAWYKNRTGVLRIYQQYLALGATPAPELWIVGNDDGQSAELLASIEQGGGKVRFVHDLNDVGLNAAYAAAQAMLFPSYAEGFGWPIVEAMACGCHVLTTNAAPMTELGMGIATLLPQPPAQDLDGWARQSARLLDSYLQLPAAEREQLRQAGLERAARFNADRALHDYERIYAATLRDRTDAIGTPSPSPSPSPHDMEGRRS